MAEPKPCSNGGGGGKTEDEPDARWCPVRQIAAQGLDFIHVLGVDIGETGSEGLYDLIYFVERSLW